MARIAGVNLPVQKHVVIGLQSIFGVGRSRARKVCAGAGVNPAAKIKDLTEAEVKYLCHEEWAQTAEDVLWRRSRLGLSLTRREAADLDGWLGAMAAAAE